MDETAKTSAAEKKAIRAQKQRERMARRSRETSQAVAEIGDIHPVADPARREACRLDLHQFLISYFPASTGLSPFGDGQRRMIERMQRCILGGGLFANAMPRGFCKSTISENSTIWATIYGHRQFAPIFSAEKKAADRIIDSIKREFETNELLHADFPEVCVAVRALEGKPQRARSQTYHGRPTYISWTSGEIVLPTLHVPTCAHDGTACPWPHPAPVAAKSCGAIILSYGLTAASRGAKFKRPDGSNARPDLIILDDPQTDESAHSPLQTVQRLEIVSKGILKSAGHFGQLAVVCNGTVIQPDDLMERLLSSKSWQGERVAMVKAWPAAHKALWMDQYAVLRQTYDPLAIGDQERAHAAATQFYREHQAEMDAGAEVAWDQCFRPATELSALQHAYNALVDDPATFASEYQNQPIRRVEGDEDFQILPVGEIRDRVNGLGRGVAPLGTEHIVSFIDVQETALYWGVGAFADNFTGSLIDYGVFPDPGRPYFALNELQKTLQVVTGAASIEGAIASGLEMLVSRLCGRDWMREDGTAHKIKRLLIDSGHKMEVINDFARSNPHAAVTMASRGVGIGARTKPMNEDKPKPGEKLGDHWKLRPSTNRVNIFCSIDTNHWKTFFHERLKANPNDPGALRLFGKPGEDHRLIADHFHGEFPTRTEGQGRVLFEWAQHPSRPDQHWLDCAVGLCVAASMCGSMLFKPASVKPVKRIRFQDYAGKRAG